MRKSPAPILFIAVLLISTTQISQAQSTSEASFRLKPPPLHIAVDGDIKEWNDSLSFYSPKERLNYMITNTKDTLYLAVKIYDRGEIARILNAGLTFSIDPKGKKKEAFSVTYPLNIQGSTPMPNHKQDNEDGITREDRDELLQERLTTLRGIKVVGFAKDIEDDMITTSNTYGIQATINYDAAGNLIYEEAIPMSFFHADESGKTQWAFNIKINGIQRPAADNDDKTGGGGGSMGGGGRHGGGRGGRKGAGNGSGNNTDFGEMFKSVDFWGKFALAN